MIGYSTVLQKNLLDLINITKILVVSNLIKCKLFCNGQYEGNIENNLSLSNIYFIKIHTLTLNYLFNIQRNPRYKCVGLYS